MKLKELLKEFKELKTKLFGDCKFAVLDEDSEEVKRYNQLLMLFYPQFRTSEFQPELFPEIVTIIY